MHVYLYAYLKCCIWYNAVNRVRPRVFGFVLSFILSLSLKVQHPNSEVTRVMTGSPYAEMQSAA